MKATKHQNQSWATRRLVLLALALVGSACDGSNGGSPTEPSPGRNLRIISLDGDMAFGTIGVGASWEATLRISSSGTEPLTITQVSMTPSSGVYSSSWTSGTIAPGSSQTATIRFTPQGAVSYNGTLTVQGNYTSGTNTMPISGTGQRDILFQRSGTGNAEFFIPTDVDRVRVIATYTGHSANFVVHNGWYVYVDERLGTAPNQTRYEATFRTFGGGDVEITNSNGVAWSFEEVR